ncbi:MAG: hypothetical protein WBA13_09705 [Microcoleaceae cyanobacterium]
MLPEVEIIKQFFDEPAELNGELKVWVEAIVTEQLADTTTQSRYCVPQRVI